MLATVINLDKLVTRSLLINESRKIPNGLQSYLIFAAAKLLMLHHGLQ